MAFVTFLLTISVVTISTAGYPGWTVHDTPFPGFPQPVVSAMRFGPTAMTGFFPHHFPFFNFPFGSSFSAISIPSDADIANMVPPKGGTVNGVIVSTKSEAKKKDDGTIVKEGGSTILINQDGVIKVEKTGNAPPDLMVNTVTRDNFDVPQMPRQFSIFDTIFSPFPFIARVGPEELKNYVPAEGEDFRGHAIRSHSYSSNVNGKISQGGNIESTDNDNGLVDAKNIVYHKDGTEDDIESTE